MADATQRRPLDELKPHPLQRLLLADLPADRLDGVKLELSASGEPVPVELLPDGTVVSHWHQVLAARRAGLQEIETLMRRDLAERGDVAVERHLIAAHLRWQQPNPLARARLYDRLVDRVLGLPKPRRGIYGRQSPRTLMAQWLGFSRRTMGRYARILTTPDEVQNAFLDGSLSLDQADQVAGLSHDLRDQIAARIRGGEEPGEVVRLSLPSEDGRHKDVRHAVRAFVRNQRLGLADLQDRADQVHELSAGDIAVLEQSAELIGQLLRQGRDPGDRDDGARDEPNPRAGSGD